MKMLKCRDGIVNLDHVASLFWRRSESLNPGKVDLSLIAHTVTSQELLVATGSVHGGEVDQTVQDIEEALCREMGMEIGWVKIVSNPDYVPEVEEQGIDD